MNTHAISANTRPSYIYRGGCLFVGNLRLMGIRFKPLRWK